MSRARPSLARPTRAVVAVVALLVLAATLAVGTRPAGAFGFPDWDIGPTAADCLQREPVIQLVGPQAAFPHRSDVPDGAGIDARQATWNESNYPIVVRAFEDQQRLALCFVGGTISSPWPHETTDWDRWHKMAGMVVKTEDVEVHGTVFHNVGDGIRFAGPAHNWTVRHVRMSQVHDDCIENDDMESGVIEESFFDGCYVFYSARGDRSDNGDRENDNVVTIRDSLVRMEAMPSIYDGREGSGHGPLLKMSGPASMGRSPQLEIYDTVIRIDQPPAHGDLKIPAYDADDDRSTPPEPFLTADGCARNTIVWLGEGPFPAELPPCFEITTDVEVWNRAVAEWEAAAQVRKVQDLFDQVIATPRG